MEGYKKYEIWGSKWITEQLNSPIPRRLLIAALNTENNILKAFEFEESDIKTFLINNGYSISVEDVDTELMKKIIDYYYHDWMD